MSGTMTPDALVPGPDCARYANVLPALAQDGADADTLAQARAHVAGCAYCAAQLAAYDALDAALARQHGDASGFPALDVAAIMRMTDMDEPHGVLLDDADGPLDEARPRHTRPLRRPSRRMADLAGIAAAILVVITVVALILSHTGFPRQAGPRKPTPTPNVVPTQQPTVNPTTGPTAAVSFASLHMVSPTFGWAVTNNGLARTADGGAHWTIVSPQDAQMPTDAPLDVVSSSEVWTVALPTSSDSTASGSVASARVYHTTDGGQTWKWTQVPQTKVKEEAMGWAFISFPDSQHGWLMEELAAGAGHEDVAIFRTTDGAQTWTEVADSVFGRDASNALPDAGSKTGMTFINASTGWVTGESGITGNTGCYVTHDGGLTWSQQTLPMPPGVPAKAGVVTYAPVFFSWSDGVMRTSIRWAQGSGQYFYVTRDGGQTWTPTHALPSDDANSWSFTDTDDGWATNGKVLYLSSNAGQSWTTISPKGAFNNSLTSLDMVSITTGFAILTGGSTGNGTLIKTTDGGRTWSSVAFASSVLFASLHMVSPTTGWAVTSSGLARTTDGGVHWTIVTPHGAQVQQNYTSLDVSVISGSEAWVADAQSPCTRIWHTTDGGQNWIASPVPLTRVQTPAAVICSAPTFVDAQHGWMMEGLGVAAGSEGEAIFRTADGGATWSEISDAMYNNTAEGALPFSGDKTGIAFINASTGWVTGTSAAPGAWLYVTHDGGQTWSQQTLTLPTLPPMGAAIPGQPVTNVPVFFSSTYGVLPVTFGNHLTYFYVTHDAGQTWTPAHAVPSGETGAWSLVDASHWVIIGLDEINSTSDAGQSWTGQSMVPFGGPYSSLDMVSPSTGFAIGSPNDTPPGNLLKTTDGGRTWTKVPVVVG